MTEREALKLALEALETLMIERGSIYDKAITAIKEALAQPEQHQDWCASLTQMLMSMPPKPAPCNCKPEPLPWIDKMVIDVPNQILYTAPQRTWIGLTDEEKASFWTADQMTQEEWQQLFAAIETKLKEKNT